MAFENLFIRTKQSINGIALDGILSEGHSNKVTPTRNPIETTPGRIATDNAVIQPKVLTIVAQVTDTPLGSKAFKKLVDDTTALFGSATEENLTRTQTAYNALVLMQESLEIIEIQTKLVNYKNMLITDISTTTDKNSYKSATITITAEQLLITESETIELKEDNLEEGKIKDQGSPPNDRGKIEAKEVIDPGKKSVAKAIVEWING